MAYTVEIILCLSSVLVAVLVIDYVIESVLIFIRALLAFLKSKK